MGKTIRNYEGKNRHNNARPYERTRERITAYCGFEEADEDLEAQKQSFDDPEDSDN